MAEQDTTTQEAQPFELKAEDVIVRLSKSGNVTLAELSDLANDPDEKVMSVKHTDKSVKLYWKHPVRRVETLVPQVDDDGKQKVDDQNRPLYDVRVDEVEDTDPQNIEVSFAENKD